MIESRTLDYDYDEENLGFKEPPKVESKPLTLSEKRSLGLVGIGVIFFIILFFNTPLRGTWTGFFLAFGPLTIGGALYFWLSYKDTEPGIKNDGNFFRNITSRGYLGWIAGVLMTGFYIVLYWWPQYLEGGVRLLDPQAQLISGAPATHWFLYGFIYTIAVLVFGIRMLMKYRGNRYQQIRTLSVMTVQLGFAFLIPNILKLFSQPEYYFSYFWPLKYDYLFPSTISYFTTSSAGLGLFFVFWGFIMTFVAVPVLTYFFGKRWYCSWVCGCGGLAETMGDPWRQLSDKSVRSWKIERWMIHSVLVFIVVVTVALWINSFTEGRVLGTFSGAAAKWYGFFIGAIFSGVVGVGFYPLMGSRVWCRFGCPLAATLGIFQRYFSRFRITTNGGQCMSCGNCSTYCEMGIDVRAYAQQGKNIIRASCVGCGVCSAVCPRGVLKLENGKTYGDRFEGSARPIQAFVDSLKHV